jgi:hypothetical protein
VDKEREKFIRDNAFREVHFYEPERVKVTRRKHGKKAAEAMRTAIALDETRRRLKQ